MTNRNRSIGEWISARRALVNRQLYASWELLLSTCAVTLMANVVSDVSVQRNSASRSRQGVWHLYFFGWEKRYTLAAGLGLFCEGSHALFAMGCDLWVGDRRFALGRRSPIASGLYAAREALDQVENVRPKRDIADYERVTNENVEREAGPALAEWRLGLFDASLLALSLAMGRVVLRA
jgi:hypothetical protein